MGSEFGLAYKDLVFRGKYTSLHSIKHLVAVMHNTATLDCHTVGRQTDSTRGVVVTQHLRVSGVDAHTDTTLRE